MKQFARLWVAITLGAVACSNEQPTKPAAGEVPRQETAPAVMVPARTAPQPKAEPSAIEAVPAEAAIPAATVAPTAPARSSKLASKESAPSPQRASKKAAIGSSF